MILARDLDTAAEDQPMDESSAQEGRTRSTALAHVQRTYQRVRPTGKAQEGEDLTADLAEILRAQFVR